MNGVFHRLDTLTHRELALCWAQWNGQTGTDKQTDRIMRQLSIADLLRMCAERQITGIGRTTAGRKVMRHE